MLKDREIEKDIRFREFPIHAQLLLSAIVQSLSRGTRVRSFLANFSRVTISCNNAVYLASITRLAFDAQNRTKAKLEKPRISSDRHK